MRTDVNNSENRFLGNKKEGERSLGVLLARHLEIEPMDTLAMEDFEGRLSAVTSRVLLWGKDAIRFR